ncbi:MAG: tRNA (adenosine(37)-N6)-threonylcarbamoyltransferase complex ATPase subunit type 1 TsaE [bacterium]|nr:tRNA (adenosine(37)-N6)-threonylcarbamoyltransferase complex ATPase subunit type 1 TsaE [bacterium]
MRYISKSIEETKQVAQKFLDTVEYIGGGYVVALQGELGAGKTAFTQEVGKILGVIENMHSPTFVIEKIYKIDPSSTSGQVGFKNLIHIDAYRLEKASELLHIGWNEIIKEPENLILIEWPENVAGIILTDAKRISFKFIDDTTREISFDKTQDKET